MCVCGGVHFHVLPSKKYPRLNARSRFLLSFSAKEGSYIVAWGGFVFMLLSRSCAYVTMLLSRS